MFNHDVEVTGGVLAQESAELLGAFFRAKRAAKAKNSSEEQQQPTVEV